VEHRGETNLEKKQPKSLATMAYAYPKAQSFLSDGARCAFHGL